MNANFLLFLMQQQPSSNEKGGGIGPMIMFGAIFIVFYFFMIRPQVKKQKTLKKFRTGLKIGDDVMTVGGIRGKVTKVSETDIKMEIAQNVQITIDKSAVTQEFSEKDMTKK